MVLFPKPMYRNLGRCFIFCLRACAGPACGSTAWPVVTQAPFRVSSLRLAKRSRALRRRNPARDSQVDRAPMALAPPPVADRGTSSFQPSDTGAMPQKISGSGAEPQPSLSTHEFCRRTRKKGRSQTNSGLANIQPKTIMPPRTVWFVRQSPSPARVRTVATDQWVGAWPDKAPPCRSSIPFHADHTTRRMVNG